MNRGILLGNLPGRLVGMPYAAIHRLTLRGGPRRETEVLRLIAEANSTKEIANRLGLSNRTVESHRTNLFAKLGCHCVAQLVRYAICHGMVQLRDPVPSERFSLPSPLEVGKTFPT